ncbi:MAG TPA: hypothetical protein VG895_03650 [Patescibacteria group bacterium]|nr:hypothetical protein [Patescibacteria group bacterium]
MNKLLMFGGIVLGVLFILISILYFITPANHLPHFIPGYSALLTRHHFTHGIGSLFLGLLCFAFAWFSGKPKTK